jgi:glycine cleavage system transcriptional repressor
MRMHQLSMAAIGRDRPGIVAAVTKVLFEQGCNLADCSMAMLSGQFAMIMLLQAPDSLTLEDLDKAMMPVRTELELSILVHQALGGAGHSPDRPYVISLYGADHPGIIYRVCSELASKKVNVTDLMSRIVGDSVYTVVLDIDLPEGLDAEPLEERLRAIAVEVGVDLNFRQAEIDSL